MGFTSFAFSFLYLLGLDASLFSDYNIVILVETKLRPKSLLLTSACQTNYNSIYERSGLGLYKQAPCLLEGSNYVKRTQ